METEKDMANIFYKKSFDLAYSFIETFCQERGIKPNIRNFLSYKKPNSYFPESIKYIHKVPYFFLLSSKAFIEWFSSLDEDAQNDVLPLTQNEISYIKNSVLINKELKEYLKSKMLNDFNG